MLDLNKGDKVIVKGFTGIKLCVSEVASATKKTITVLKKTGEEMIFDRKTGKQINVEEGKEKFANSVMADDGSFVAPTSKVKKPTKTKKAAPKKPVVEDDDDEDEDEEEVPAPKAKKPAKKQIKKPAKKPVKKPVVEDDEDDEEDDDDFEEVD